MKNIHVLPTENSSRVSYNKDGVLELHRLQWRKNTQNIYITSDEEIKEGDWYIHKQINYLRVSNSNSIPMDAKKIILTTDQDLIKDGVQAIPDEFLEWFVKNPSCEKVEVVKEINKSISAKEPYYKYKIIIPEEEQKQHLIDMMEQDEQLGLYQEPKKETLEEAVAKKLYPLNDGFQVMDIDISEELQLAFLNGAKWQQERSYSKEEVETIAKDAYTMGRNNILIGVFNKWFEQFKKKISI
jgi:hypothetical protein